MTRGPGILEKRFAKHASLHTGGTLEQLPLGVVAPLRSLFSSTSNAGANQLQPPASGRTTCGRGNQCSGRQFSRGKRSEQTKPTWFIF